MLATRPRFVLIAEAEVDEAARRWRFALHSVDSTETIAACDDEDDAGPERLELIALVRGLEALDQPSDVTLVTRNPSIARAMQRGLREWRNNHWRWERFGRLTPVRNADLWRRVDRALAFHRVDCRIWRFDGPAAEVAGGPRVANRSPERSSPAFVDRRFGSPAMVIVPSKTRRRRVRLASREPAAVAG